MQSGSWFGDAGVGKTALKRLGSLSIASDVPAKVAKMRVGAWLMNVACTLRCGDFEERMNIKDIKKIYRHLFIDELHTIMGLGMDW